MKKIRIPFSLDEYNKGGYEVETRGSNLTNPHKVRIVCIDRKYEYYPILALISYETVEEAACYRLDGRYIDLECYYQDLVLVKQEFEDGDIITTHRDVINFIIPYRGTGKNGGVLTEVYCNSADLKINMHPYATRGCGYTRDYRLATEEEKKMFFDALKKEGKCWNAETKQVENIKSKLTFEPTEWCLMRTASDYAWCLCQFSNMDSDSYVAIGGAMHEYCIPYNDETKHLLGTTEDAPEKYKTW